MEVRLLWFDDSADRSLEKKVKAAAEAYCGKERFKGQRPDTCYVHPSLLPDGRDGRLNGVWLAGAPSISPHSFLVGMEQDGESGGE